MAKDALVGQTVKPQPPKFHVGDHVNHAAACDGAFPASCGTVHSVTPWNDGNGSSYQVKCDKTGKVLGVNFKESELSLVD